MNLKQLFDDEQAVSPVIGVILMVAITVILAAVIGTFVLGLGDQVQNNAPSAQFTFSYTDGGSAGFNGKTGDKVTITHEGGDSIPSSELTISQSGSTALSTTSFSATTVSTGTSETVKKVQGGETIRIIWQNPNGQSSTVIASSTNPN